MDAFTIIRKLRDGGTSTVCLASHDVSGQLYAIKSICNDGVFNKERFLRTEIQALVSLHDSPFVVDIYAVNYVRDSNTCDILLEYVERGDMYDKMATAGTVTMDECRFLLACLCVALQDVHDAGFLFKDLKPENILLGDDGYIKLCDFGYSHNVKKNGLCSTMEGTYEYLPPEIFEEGASYKGDVYALGMCSLEFALGSRDLSLMHALQKKVPSLASLIRRMLEPDPRKRPSLEEVRKDPYFSGIDWDLVREKKYVPLF